MFHPMNYVYIYICIYNILPSDCLSTLSSIVGFNKDEDSRLIQRVTQSKKTLYQRHITSNEFDLQHSIIEAIRSTSYSGTIFF